MNEPLSLPGPLILTLFLKFFDVTFKEFDFNEIMQKNKTEWKVKLTSRLSFLEEKKKNSQEQGTPKGGEHPITPAIKQIGVRIWCPPHGRHQIVTCL